MARTKSCSRRSLMQSGDSELTVTGAEREREEAEGGFKINH